MKEIRLIGTARQACVVLASGCDAHNFQPITGLHPAMTKLAVGDRLAVVFNHHTPWQQVLCSKKVLKRAGELSRGFLAVGDYSFSHSSLRLKG